MKEEREWGGKAKKIKKDETVLVSLLRNMKPKGNK